MQNQYAAPVDGVEVQRGDLNTVAKEAAIAEDRVFNELFRPVYYGSSTVDKRIAPYGLHHADPMGNYAQNQGVVAAPGTANASVIVRPFRAVLGMRSADTNPDGARTTHVEAFTTTMQLAATTSNHRWDLIYARVNVDTPGANVSRFVKSADGTVGVQDVSVFTNTTVTIAKVQGSEGASPSRPSLPADTGSAYYIPLAYVLVQHPHTLTSVISATQIHEVAPLIGLATSLGGVDAQPMDYCHRQLAAGLGGFWTPAAGRPREYMPPTMVGKVERFFGLDFLSGHQTLTLGNTTLLDSTIDWRKRVFKVTALAQVSGRLASTGDLSAINTTPFPSGLVGEAHVFMGQSLTNTALAGYNAAGGIGRVASLDSTIGMATLSSIRIYVNASTGYLAAEVGSTSPNCLIFIWIEASGPFSNVF